MLGGARWLKIRQVLRAASAATRRQGQGPGGRGPRRSVLAPGMGVRTFALGLEQ